MIKYMDKPNYIEIKKGWFRKRRIDIEVNYHATLDLQRDDMPFQAHGYNDHYFDNNINLVWGDVHAILSNFTAASDFLATGEFDFDGLVMELVFVFLYERVCMELSLLDEDEFNFEENRKYNCKKGICIINPIVYEMLDIEWIEDEEGGFYIKEWGGE